MEGEQETPPKLSNGTSLNDLQWPFHGHTILWRWIYRKQYDMHSVIEILL